MSHEKRYDKLFRNDYAYDPDTMLGGLIRVDPEVELMNEVSRMVELLQTSPFVVNLVWDRAIEDFEPGSMFADNVFLWTSETQTLTAAPHFTNNIGTVTDCRGPTVAMLVLYHNGEDYAEMLFFDDAKKTIHRMHGQTVISVDFHSAALDEALGGYFARVLPEYSYEATDEIAVLSQAFFDEIDFLAVAPQDKARIVGKQWTWWLIHLRLQFPGVPYQELLKRTMGYLRANPAIASANALLNWYPYFTDTGNFHAFGSVGFLQTYDKACDVPRYEGRLIKALHRNNCIGHERQTAS